MTSGSLITVAPLSLQESPLPSHLLPLSQQQPHSSTTLSSTDLLPPLDELIASFVGTLVSISSILLIRQYCKQPISGKNIQVFASFGASAALVHGAPHSPFAQPRNAFIGQFIGGICGLLYRLVIDGSELQWLAGSLAVATSILLMQITRTLHPPAAATALIFCLVYTRESILSGDGFIALLLPLAVGVFIQFIVAVICNFQTKKKKYPLGWFLKQ